MLRFSEAIVVSCSGAVLCLCSSLPFVDQHGTTVHLFMIYFSQWLGPDYIDKHSGLFEGQLDLCNDTQTVLKLWECFQTKTGQWKNSTGSSLRRAFLSLSPGNKTKNLIFYLEFFCSYQCQSDPQKLKRRQEKKTRPGPFWHFKMHISEEIIKSSIQFRRSPVSWSPLAQMWIPELEDLPPHAGAEDRAWKVQLFWGAPCTARVVKPSLVCWLTGPRERMETKGNKSTTQRAAGWSHRVSSEKIQNAFVVWTRSFPACFRMI